MTSFKSMLSYQYRKKTHAKYDLKKQLSTLSHGKLSEMVPPESLAKKYSVQTYSKNGRPIYHIGGPESERRPRILYFHGGAFLTGLTKKHWGFAEALLGGTGCSMVIPDYPLVPEHTCRKISSFCMELYEAMLPHCPGGIILMGDSAGAALAMITAQQAVQRKLPLPHRLLLLSPLLDATKNNPVKNVLAPRDPVLEPEGCQEAALLYAGSEPLDSPLVSPIFGSMKGLPKVFAWTGTNDMLYADTLLLREALHQAKTPYHIYTYPDMVHDWMFDGFRESRHAIRQILQAVNAGLIL